MRPLRPGDPERIGAYSLVGLLGEGPRGEVFLGRESDDAPAVAIKLLPAEPEPGPDSLAKFLGAKRISSSYVARVLDAGFLEDRPYIVREHVEGKSLAELVTDGEPLTGDALERIAVGVLTALSAIHLAGLTHRALTPYNVIVAAEGPRVTDAALGEPAGEAVYQAPEQLEGLQYGPYADVFAWAATVVFAGTGKAPFADREAVLNAEPEIGVEAERIRKVLVSALAKEVGPRPTTYSALMQVLGETGGGAKPAVEKREAPIEGVPLQGIPVQGGPVQAQAPIGSPAGGPPQGPMPGGPPQGPMPGMPPQGPMPGMPFQGPPPVPGPPAQHPPMGPPMQGVPGPVVPRQPERTMWGPPPEGDPQQPRPIRLEAVPGRTASQTPRRGFPMMLVAGIGTVALVAAIGLWGATKYVKIEQVSPVAQAGEDTSASGATDIPVPQGSDPGAYPQPTQPEATVPWAAGDTDQSGVGPLVLPTEWSSTDAPAVPELTSVPSSPAPIPTMSVPVPTQAPPATTAQPTPTAKAKSSPKATVTKTVQPTKTATPTKKAEPTPTQEPEPAKTTAQPRPTKTTAAPAPAKTTAKAQQPAPVKNPYTAAQACGSGYSVQRSSAVSGGTVYQLWNNSAGKNCAVTMKSVDVGKKTSVSVSLEAQNGGSDSDSGSYEYYAGPVYVSAAGKCVRISGSVGSSSTSTGWDNCG